MNDDPSSKRGTNEQNGKEAIGKWEMWYPCPVCHETELNMYIESELSVSTTEHGAREKTTSAGEYEYIECSGCNEILYENTEDSQHL
jgi:hypothetical protein